MPFCDPQYGSISLPPFRQEWDRPSGWVELPVPTETAQQFYGLYPVFEHGSHVALRVDGTESYEVNWGDGTVTTHLPNTVAEHQYDYNDIPAWTEHPRGYRQVVVSVKMLDGGDMTLFSLDEQPSFGDTYGAAYWLDINLNGPNLTSISISPDNNVFLPILERAVITNVENVTSFDSLFRYARSLKEVVITGSGNVTTAELMFEYSGISNAPIFDMSSIVSARGMFRECYELAAVGDLYMPALQDAEDLFAYDYALRSISKLYAPALTTATAMFSSCYSLLSVPVFDTSNVTDADYMFGNTYALAVVPAFDLSQATVASIVANAGTAVFKATGITNSVTFDVYGDLSREAIVEIFTNLGTALPGAIVDVASNYGAASLTPADILIATSKGWTVTV